MALLCCWPQETGADRLIWTAFATIDFVGGLSLFCGTGFLVFALQQGGSQAYQWLSPEIMTTLILSGLSWGIFIMWQVILTRDAILNYPYFTSIQPVFPARLLRRRVYTATLV
jgi:hypothetical protein